MVYVAKALKQLNSLKVLKLGNTNIPKEAIDDLALAIKYNQCLNTLELQHNKLQSSSIVVILKAISKISSLKVLNLHSNLFNECAGEYLSSAILNNPTLNALHIDGTCIGKGMVHVAKALQKVTTLEVLGLGFNLFPTNTRDELGLAIQANEHLQSLLLLFNNLNSNVLQLLSNISTLHILNLRKTCLLNEAGNLLSDVILHNSRLVYIDISDNDLNDGALQVIKAIKHLKQLETLALGNINLTSANNECGEDLSETIINNTHLTDIDLNSNSIEGIVMQVTKSLQHLSSLKKLNLSNCNLPDEACGELVHVVDSNKYLEELILSKNNFGSSKLLFLQALRRISTLKALNLQDTQLTEETGECLTALIQNTTEFKTFLLNDNSIGQGILQITKAFQQHKLLKSLGLSNTNMPFEASTELALAIKCNQGLSNFQLHGNNLCLSAVVILKALREISSLTVLDLRTNGLTEHAGECISSVTVADPGGVHWLPRKPPFKSDKLFVY